MKTNKKELDKLHKAWENAYDALNAATANWDIVRDAEKAAKDAWKAATQAEAKTWAARDAYQDALKKGAQ